MTDNEIRDIARKYAEHRYPQCKTYDDEALRAAARADMEEKLAFLLRDHCVVSKSKVQEQYSANNYMYKISLAPIWKGKLIAFKELFGSQIGKEGEE